jgi:hypothetical protein
MIKKTFDHILFDLSSFCLFSPSLFFFSILLSKTWVWDPESEIRKKTIPDPESRIQGSKRNRIPDPGSGSATLLPKLFHIRKGVADPDPFVNKRLNKIKINVI